jgi:hypothetical protein
LANRWVDLVIKAESTDALKQIWTNGLVDFKKAKDLPAYNKFKAAVEKRGAELKELEEKTVEGVAQ